MGTQEPSLYDVYHLLLNRFGPQFWWPAESLFEMMVGAVLTQNTAWRNVEYSIIALKGADALAPSAMAHMDECRLQELIRSSGFFRQKAHCLQRLAAAICHEYGGDPARFLAGGLGVCRRRLLAFPGVGPETADCMLLYGARYPIFVVDAYTRRIFSRLGLVTSPLRYDAFQHWVMTRLDHDRCDFGEYHALLVQLAKECCLARHPRCDSCPLVALCPAARF